MSLKTYQEPTVLLVYIGAHSDPGEWNSVSSSLEETRSAELHSLHSVAEQEEESSSSVSGILS